MKIILTESQIKRLLYQESNTFVTKNKSVLLGEQSSEQQEEDLILQSGDEEKICNFYKEKFKKSWDTDMSEEEKINYFIGNRNRLDTWETSCLDDWYRESQFGKYGEFISDLLYDVATDDDVEYSFDQKSQQLIDLKNFLVNIASPAKWMELLPETMGLIFDPNKDPEKFKEVKKLWGEKTPREVEKSYTYDMFFNQWNLSDEDLERIEKQSRETSDEYYKQLEKNRELSLEYEKMTGKNDPSSPYYIPKWKQYGFESEEEYNHWWNETGGYTWGNLLRNNEVFSYIKLPYKVWAWAGSLLVRMGISIKDWAKEDVPEWWHKEFIPAMEYIWMDIKNQFGEASADGFFEWLSYLTSSSTYEYAPEGFNAWLEMITGQAEPQNYDFKEGFESFFEYWRDDIIIPAKDYLVDCITVIFSENDWHCFVDLLSIVVLAIPGIGPVLSAGIDAAHGAWYLVAAYNADNQDESDAHMLGAVFSFFGAYVGGGKTVAKELIMAGKENKEIYMFVDDLIKSTEKAGKDLTEKEIEQIWKKYNLTEGDTNTAYRMLEKIGEMGNSKEIKQYLEAVIELDGKLTTAQKAHLKKAMLEEEFQTLLKQNDNDVIKSLNQYMKTEAGREALFESGMFIQLGLIMENEAIQKWIGQGVYKIRNAFSPSVRNMVLADGYVYSDTTTNLGVIELFGVDTNNKDQEIYDLGNLYEAWNAGWRPYLKDNEGKPLQYTILEKQKWLEDNPQYQTEKNITDVQPYWKEALKEISPEIKTEILTSLENIKNLTNTSK